MEEWVLNAKREAYEHGFEDGRKGRELNVNAYCSIVEQAEMKDRINEMKNNRGEDESVFDGDKDLIHKRYCEEVEQLNSEKNDLEQSNRMLLKDLSRRCDTITELEIDLNTLRSTNQRLTKEVEELHYLREQVTELRERRDAERDRLAFAEGLIEQNVMQKREILALEELVCRYQSELDFGSRSDKVVGDKVDGELIRIDEEIWEHERLYPRGWSGHLLPTDRPSFCRLSLEPCNLDEVDLPTPDWQWVGSWYTKVTNETDSNGWIYGFTWEQLDLLREGGRREKLWSDVVRRRLWVRERMMIAVSNVSDSVNRSLVENHKMASLEVINRKLTDQILKQQNLITEYEQKLVALELSNADKKQQQTTERENKNKNASKVMKWRPEREIQEIIEQQHKNNRLLNGEVMEWNEYSKDKL